MPKDRGDYSPSPSLSLPPQRVVPLSLAGMRLDQVLAQLMPEHSRSRLQAWIRAGRVSVDALVAQDLRRRMWGGELLVVSVDEPADAGDDLAEAIPLAVAFEDEALVVIDKPVGLVVHPGSGNRSGTLLNALLHHCPGLCELPRAGIVHRLDKDTSGLLVVAKTLTAQTDLVRQLQARSISRHYLAVLRGRVGQDGSVDAPIGRHPVQRTRMAVVAGGREARTHFGVRELFRNASLVECKLETGRTHQIRVHMKSIGHPLLGDTDYGGGAARGWGIGRQALHAWRLGLRHPVSGDAMQWESPLPHDMLELITLLRSDRDG